MVLQRKIALKQNISIFFLLLFCLGIHNVCEAGKGDNFLNRGNTQYLKGKLDDAMKLYAKAGNSCIEEKDKIENNKALVYAQRGKHQVAIEKLTEAIEYNPNSVYAHYNRGIIHLQIGEYPNAIQDLNDAKFLSTEEILELDYNLALSYYLNEQADLASQILDTAGGSATSSSGQEDYLRGLIAYQNRNFDKAIVAFDQSIIANDNPSVRYAKALANYYAGNTEAGLNSLEKLRKEKSIADNIQTIYAHLALENKDTERAKEAFESIINKDKKNAIANAGLGNLALKDEQLKIAEDYFKTALSGNAKNETALLGLAEIAFVQEEYESSVETYDKALAINPDNQRALFGKALSAMHRPDPYTCLDALEKINKDNLTAEQIEKVVLLEARALGICNKKEEAVKLLNKYRRYALDKNKIKTLLAYFNLRMFRYGTATSNIGISKFDDYLPYLIAGHASLHQGKYSSAYRYYRKAYKIDNKNPDVLMGAALCMMETDMRDQAVKVIDSLEVMFPDNYYVFNSKGIIYKDLGLHYKRKGQTQKAKNLLETAAVAFNRAKAIRPPLGSSFDNNLGLTYLHRDEYTKAIKLFEGSSRLASKNNRALIDITKGNYPAAIRKLDSLHRDFIRKNDVPNTRVKKNLKLANQKARMDNNYKFITYYFLHQDIPTLDRENPFEADTSILDLSPTLEPKLDYILEYSDEECIEEKKERKKKKRSKIKLKVLKKKKSIKCPTFKT